MKHKLSSYMVGLCALLAVGCAPQRSLPARQPATVELPDIKAPVPLEGDGVKALVAVMDKYAKLKTFQSTVRWEFITNGDTAKKAESERLILVESPNKHRVVAVTGTMTFTSVSDGKNVLEFAGSNGKLTLASKSVATAEAENIRDPQLAGSLIFQLFRGGNDIHRLVDKVDPVILVPNSDGEFTTVRFKAIGRFGTTELKINNATGLVDQIQCQFEPFVKETESLPASDRLRSILVTEKFENVKVNAPLAPDAFSTKAPSGLRVKDETKPVNPDDAGILSEGMMAPDFEMTSLDGKKVKLSDMRGQVVLLDFWATWCVPCKVALPKTLAIHQKYGGKGLQVWTIPEEDAETVKVFLKEEGLAQLPVLLDPNKSTSKLYQIVALPTYVLINPAGEIEKVYNGAPDTRDLLESLRDAGLPI